MKKITFVGDFVYNCGSAQTILEYEKVAKSYNIVISVSGYVDNVIGKRLPVIEQVNRKNTDIVIFIFENTMYLNPNKYPERLEGYLKNIDRKNRVVIDTDGRYGLYCGTDYIISEDEKMWDSVINQLTDIVLQPTLKAKNKKIVPFYFFGFPIVDIKIPNKIYDITYVGNNWFREREMVSFLKAAAVSKVIKKVKIWGKDWNKHNLSQIPLDIKIEKSVLPEELIKTMSFGCINPILVNNTLLKRRLVTPRMFETFAADTIPLFYDNFDYACNLYGEIANEFSSNEFLMKDKIRDVIENPHNYLHYRNVLRAHLSSLHSYKKRLQDLKKILSIK